MSIIIRKAVEKDKEVVLELGRKIVDKYERTHLGDEMADSYIGSGACDSDLSKIYDNCTIALDGEQIVGFIFTQDNEIQGLAVDIPYWSKGIAQKLIAYATRVIFAPYDEIHLECFVSSPRANRFYQKMGFVVGDTVDGDGGSRAIYKRRINGDNLSPKELLLNWIDTFNHIDAEALSEFYADDATNHQVVSDPVVGKAAIYQRFVEEYALAEMICIPQNIFEDKEWAIMEWRDPKGFRGCGFFHFVDGKLIFQRGYMDKLSFLKMNGLPIE